MANWLERAKSEIQKSADQSTDNTDERNLTAVTTVPNLGKSEISLAGLSSDGIAPRTILAEAPTVAVTKPRSLEPTQSLIEDIPEHKEEVKSILAENSPEMQAVSTHRLTNSFPFGACVTEEIWQDQEVLAEKVFSKTLEEEIWLILDESFNPNDRLARFYADELPTLWNKTPKELRDIHRVKSVVLGCRVIQ